jgi:outer membrane immunogenic protein
VEYLYYYLGNETLNLNYAGLPGGGGVGNAINYTFSERGGIARVGLNYKFSSGPIVSKY